MRNKNPEISKNKTAKRRQPMIPTATLINFFISRLTHLAVPYDLSLAGLNQISVIWRPMPFLSLWMWTTTSMTSWR